MRVHEGKYGQAQEHVSENADVLKEGKSIKQSVDSCSAHREKLEVGAFLSRVETETANPGAADLVTLSSPH